jgi:hypothetical protein
VSTQKFKGSILTQGEVVSNMLGFYDAADAQAYNTGMKWYENAHLAAMEMAFGYGFTLPQAVGVIAAFSPQCDWDNNLKYAEEFFKTGHAGRTGLQLKKAKEVSRLDSAIEIRKALSVSDGALKVKSFYDCILDPWSESVVIDRHAIACALQQPGTVGVLSVNVQSLTPAQYWFLNDAYVRAADMIGIRGNQMQGVTWESYRALRKLRQHKMQAA